MSSKFIRILALASLALVAGTSASVITLDGAYAQGKGDPKGGGPNGGGGNGGGDDSAAAPLLFEAIAERLPSDSLVLCAAGRPCPWNIPVRVKTPKVTKTDNCGGYLPVKAVSDPLIYYSNWRCDR